MDQPHISWLIQKQLNRQRLTSITRMSLALCFWTLGCWILTATVFPSCSTALWTCAKEAAPWGFSSKDRNNSDNWRRQRGGWGIMKGKRWRIMRWEQHQSTRTHTHALPASILHILLCTGLPQIVFSHLCIWFLTHCLFHTLQESISGPITIKSAEKSKSKSNGNHNWHS